MAREMEFQKSVAAGNDFIIIDNRKAKFPASALIKLAVEFCDRKFGIGADGLLVLEKSQAAQVKMRIFNSDGSEAEMCGNGARCFSLYYAQLIKINPSKTYNFNFQTKAGIIYAQVNGDLVKVRLTAPKGINLDMPLKVDGRQLKVNFVNTGVPHAVIFVEGLDKIRILDLARKIRYHRDFSPRGTNVNFVEVLGNNSIKVRTYERGVEDETLACGTGSVGSSVIFALKAKTQGVINVYPASKELLRVYLYREEDKFREVWLEGKVKMVFRGRIKVDS